MEPIKRSVTAMMRLNTMNDTTPIERTQLLQRLGIQSDAAQIQARGGLYIQDPAQAERQAQNEDIEMMNHRAVQVSFADNHQVHMETHDQIMSSPEFKTLPADIQKLFNQHMKDHMAAEAATEAAPGLMPNADIAMPNQPSLNDPGMQDPGAMPLNQAQNPNPLLVQEQQLVQQEDQLKQQQQQEQQQFAAQHQQVQPQQAPQRFNPLDPEGQPAGNKKLKARKPKKG
jgi:hypothetical protein